MSKLEGLLSIDEHKTSALIVCLVIMIIFVIVLVAMNKVIDAGIISVIQTLIYGTLGVNGVNGVTSSINSYTASIQSTAVPCPAPAEVIPAPTTNDVKAVVVNSIPTASNISSRPPDI